MQVRSRELVSHFKRNESPTKRKLETRKVPERSPNLTVAYVTARGDHGRIGGQVPGMTLLSLFRS